MAKKIVFKTTPDAIVPDLKKGGLANGENLINKIAGHETITPLSALEKFINVIELERQPNGWYLARDTNGIALINPDRAIEMLKQGLAKLI